MPSRNGRAWRVNLAPGGRCCFRPIALVAVYTHQYMVTLVDLTGFGAAGLRPVDGHRHVPTQPEKPDFEEPLHRFAGYSGKVNTIQVLVTPVTVTRFIHRH